MEVGLTPNIVKGINIFIADVIKECPYNYDWIVQMLWKEGHKKKNLYFESVWNDAMWHFEISDCILNPQTYLH